MFPGPNGQCKSLCPDGSSDPVSIELCWSGFDPHPADLYDPSTWKCLDGTKPIQDANGYHCTKTKMQVCPAGFEPDPSNEGGCKMIPAQSACFAGNEFKQVGLDGRCQTLCQNGQWGFAANQCCPDGTLPGPDGKCEKPKLPGCPPGQLTSKGICCEPGTKPQPDGSCFPMKKPCPPEQLSSNGICCPAGTKRQPDGSCYPPPPKKQDCKVEQMTPNGTCCPPGTKPQSDNTCGPQQTGCPPGTTTNPLTGQCCPPASAVAGAAAACTCPPDTVLVGGKCVANAPPVPIKKPNACFTGYVQLPNGSCCLAGQATAGGQCCPSGQKPDADKRKCVPASGATFVPVAPHAPAPVIIPRGKRGGREFVPPPPPRIVVQPPKRRFGPPKRFVPPKRVTPAPIVRQPNLVAPRFRRELDR